MKTELELIDIAQNHSSNEEASKAMKELKQRFDESYFWCEDCDGLVCKINECCINIDYSKISDEDILF